MTLIDTNVILRYLLNDIPEQAQKSEEIINRGAFTLPKVVAEVVYVLYKLYNIPKEKINSIVSPIFDEVEIAHKDVVLSALELYSSTSLDFVDSLLISRNKLLGEKILSFDKKLNNKLQNPSYEVC